MKYYLLATLALFTLGGAFSVLRQMQMFQQNSYFPSRYLKWFRLNLSPAYALSIGILFITSALCAVNATHYIIVFAIAEVAVRIPLAIKQYKHSIKKLVFTKRVLRLYFAICIFYIALLFIAGFFPCPATYIIVLTAAHISPAVLLICNSIVSPVEKLISLKFINEAKKIMGQNKDLLVIGVTGSYGKTSVKFILKRILSEKFNTVATPESFNTPMGIVRTVREHMRPSTEVFIAEMGAKNIGDIKELCNLCHPTHGIITAVGPQHLETFLTIENVAATKFELAEECFSNGGNVYVNFDSPEAAKYAESNYTDKPVISYGSVSGTNAAAKNISVSPAGTSFTLSYKNHKIDLSCKLLGRHSITNILGAASLALDLGLSESQIRFAVASLKPTPHRLEIKPFLNGSILIDDAYNANPVGCMEAISVLGSFDSMKKIIVTPGLVELGDGEYEHNQRLGRAAAKVCDIIILVGEKRAELIKNGITTSGFDTKNLHVVHSFANAMQLLKTITDDKTAVLFENDLPDNYAG